MSKSVLISIRPKWVELIANNQKTIEIRKTRPQIPTPFKCYIYCTMGGDALYSVNGKVQPCNSFELDLTQNNSVAELNGYVIGEFVCDRIAEICLTDEGYDFDCPKMTALSYAEMEAYLGRKRGYGWHISALKIYDKPKELSEFIRPCCERVSDCGTCTKFDRSAFSCNRNNTIARPPQSWCYVEELAT